MHRSRLTVVAGAVVASTSLALTFADLPPVGPVQGIDAEAWPALTLLGSLVVLNALGDRAEPPVRWAAYSGLALAAGALGYSTLKLADALMAAGESGGAVGAGAWVLFGGTLLAALGAGLGLSRRI